MKIVYFRLLTLRIPERHVFSYLINVCCEIREEEPSLLFSLAQVRVRPRLAARHRHDLVTSQVTQAEVLHAVLVENTASRKREIELARAAIQELLFL